MSFDIVFAPEAEAEYYEAIQYYETKRRGLGFEFIACFEEVIANLKHHPDICPVLYGDRRRCPMRRFPYHVIYIVEEQQVVIIQVFHKRMNPAVQR